MEAKKWTDYTEILAAGAHSISGAGAAVRLVEPSLVPNGISFAVDLTAAASTALDTIDIYIETMVDGVHWNPIAHFTQMLGDGGVKRFVITVPELDAAYKGENEEAAALGAGSVRTMFGDEYRVAWTINDVSGLAAFTFSVQALVF